jgi:hypothetical protein
MDPAAVELVADDAEADRVDGPTGPWITRPATMTAMFGARAATRLPAAIAPRITSRVFSLPIMSPTAAPG